MPERADLDEVDERWARFRAHNPAAYDGPLLQVLGVHRDGHGGATVHVVETSYRFHAVQSDRPGVAGLERGIDLGVRPLGAKAVVRERGPSGAGAAGPVLFGRRSVRTGGYHHLWEVAPGGVVEPGESPADTVRRELEEETGLVLAASPGGGSVPRAILLVEDPVMRCWELVHALEVPAGSRDRTRPSPEHDDLGWFDPADPPRPLSPITERILELVRTT